MPLDVYAFNSYPNQVITTYNAQGLAEGPPISYLNITAEAANSTFPFIDRKSQSGNFAPYSMAWNLESERTVKPWLMVRVKYLQSHEQDMITLQPETIQNKPAFVLSSSGCAKTRQTELTARIGSASPRQFFFSYVRQYAFGNINDAGSYLGKFSFASHSTEPCRQLAQRNTEPFPVLGDLRQSAEENHVVSAHRVPQWISLPADECLPAMVAFGRAAVPLPELLLTGHARVQGCAAESAARGASLVDGAQLDQPFQSVGSAFQPRGPPIWKALRQL